MQVGQHVPVHRKSKLWWYPSRTTFGLFRNALTQTYRQFSELVSEVCTSPAVRVALRKNDGVQEFMRLNRDASKSREGQHAARMVRVYVLFRATQGEPIPEGELLQRIFYVGQYADGSDAFRQRMRYYADSSDASESSSNKNRVGPPPLTNVIRLL